jgi:tetratricopeptide (TPR) repeat protein
LKFCFIIFLISVSASAATSQSVRGEIISTQTIRTPLMAELQDSVHHSAVERALIGANNMFEFHNIEEGSYEIRIITDQGEILKRENVLIRGMNDTISILIDRPRANSPQVARPGDEQISLARLQHKVPRKARKEYEKAHSRLSAQDRAGSLIHLQNAVAIDPGYVEAYNDLGCRYFELGRNEEALSALRRALELDANSGITHSNLALVLTQFNDYSGAEAAARRGLALNANDEKSHYVFGLVMFGQNKFTNETLLHLRAAGHSFPKARLLAARVLVALGSVADARTELNAYLRTGVPDRRMEVERWLSTLK